MGIGPKDFRISKYIRKGEVSVVGPGGTQRSGDRSEQCLQIGSTSGITMRNRQIKARISMWGGVECEELTMIRGGIGTAVDKGDRGSEHTWNSRSDDRRTGCGLELISISNLDKGRHIASIGRVN